MRSSIFDFGWSAPGRINLEKGERLASLHGASIVDRVYGCALVLNATALHGFFAPHIGTPPAAVTTILLAVNLFYLLLRCRHTYRVLRLHSVLSWVGVLAIWPLLTLIHASDADTRAIGLQLFYCSLFLATVVYATSAGRGAVYLAITISLAISIGGLILSAVAPSLFEPAASLAGTSIDKESRLFGFYLQPNSLAIALVLMFAASMRLLFQRHQIYATLTTVGVLVAVATTGSRTGMVCVLALSVCALFRRPESRTHRRALVIGFFLVVATAAHLMSTAYVRDAATLPNAREDLIARLETMLAFRFTSASGTFEDGSFQQRIAAQQEYVGLLVERPLLGHGVGSDSYFRQLGILPASAHSSALSNALEYGITYPMVVTTLFLLLWRRPKGVESSVQAFAVRPMSALALVLYMIASPADLRVFYIAIGICLATDRAEQLSVGSKIQRCTAPRTRPLIMKNSSGSCSHERVHYTQRPPASIRLSSNFEQR